MLIISDPLAAQTARPTLFHLNRQLRKELAQLGITGSQHGSSGRCSSNPGIGVPRQLAAGEGVSPPAMTAYVDRLEAAGLVARRRSERDRRRVELALTDEGVRCLPLRAGAGAWVGGRPVGAPGAGGLEAVEAALPALRKLLDGA